jgi:hypothetical protein
MNNPIIELYTIPTLSQDTDWQTIIAKQDCGYLGKKCIKVRKSQPELSIGTCSIRYGVKQPQDLVICPHRYLERGQVFLDCLHLLTLHEPGNELHKIPEIEIPGGSIDYFLVSARAGRVIDFVAIELQALDTTGSFWIPRQKYLASVGISTDEELTGEESYGINWKMTAKTTLVQLHHKVETFERLGKHLVLVLQDALLNYVRREFNFQHIQDAKLGHTMHFHAYSLWRQGNHYRLDLASRSSTDASGIALSLGLQASPDVELDVILNTLQSKLSASTLLSI